MTDKDVGLRTLLDLSGHVIDQEDGYWIKIEAWEVGRSDDIPHGIRYSLTLHALGGRRILGYGYEFKDANQLLSDFFVEVDAVLKEVKSR
jgi:hypothetical protein